VGRGGWEEVRVRRAEGSCGGVVGVGVVRTGDWRRGGSLRKKGRWLYLCSVLSTWTLDAQGMVLFSPAVISSCGYMVI